MNFLFGPRLIPAPVQRCGLCRQNISPSRQESAEQGVALFGRAAYATCLSCRQEVADHRDRNYRARVRRWARRSWKEKPSVPAAAADPATETFTQTWMRLYERIFHI